MFVAEGNGEGDGQVDRYISLHRPLLIMQCPKCDSEAVKAGTKLLSGRRVQRYQCKVCGHLFREPDAGGEHDDQ